MDQKVIEFELVIEFEILKHQKGHFLFRNRNGREVIIQLPPYLLYSPNVKASSTPENTET